MSANMRLQPTLCKSGYNNTRYIIHWERPQSAAAPADRKPVNMVDAFQPPKNHHTGNDGNAALLLTHIDGLFSISVLHRPGKFIEQTEKNALAIRRVASTRGEPCIGEGGRSLAIRTEQNKCKMGFKSNFNPIDKQSRRNQIKFSPRILLLHSWDPYYPILFLPYTHPTPDQEEIQGGKNQPRFRDDGGGVVAGIGVVLRVMDVIDVQGISTFS